MPTVTELARRFQDELDGLDEEALTRIVRAYSRIYKTLESKIDALLLELSTLDSPSVTQLYKLQRYKALTAQIVEEVTKFQAYLETEILSAAELSFNLGVTQSNQLMKTMLSEAGITAQFGKLPKGIFEAMVSFLQEGSPLYDRISMMAGTDADYVRNALAEAVALGYNPIKTARIIKDAFGRGLTDALRMTRTAQLWASRYAAQANYLASGVLDGWVWYAHLDDTVCQSCIVQHGKVYPLEEILNDHHNGRCIMLPYIAEFGNPVEEDGETWFNKQAQSVQKKILGKGKYEAWTAGKFTLDKLSREVENDVYGLMRSVTPLKELIK